jgi:hypothetical protein
MAEVPLRLAQSHYQTSWVFSESFDAERSLPSIFSHQLWMEISSLCPVLEERKTTTCQSRSLSRSLNKPLPCLLKNPRKQPFDSESIQTELFHNNQSYK